MAIGSDSWYESLIFFCCCCWINTVRSCCSKGYCCTSSSLLLVPISLAIFISLQKIFFLLVHWWLLHPKSTKSTWRKTVSKKWKTLYRWSCLLKCTAQNQKQILLLKPETSWMGTRPWPDSDPIHCMPNSVPPCTSPLAPADTSSAMFLNTHTPPMSPTR